MARRPRNLAPAEADPQPEHSWNVRDAKAHLSQVVNGALQCPQRIARRDGASVVVLNEEAYRNLLERAEGQVDMVDYFRAHAIGGDMLEVPARRRPRTPPALD